MSQFDDDDSKPWTEHDLKEAMRRINAGEINVKEAENYYGISPRTIHRQRAIENMRAQLNPEKAKKAKTTPSSSTKKDVAVLRKPVDISCSSISDVVTLLDTGTEEVKHLLNYECDLIYECKVCKNLFRSLVNFLSHKRVYCCDMYSVLHTRTDEGESGNETNEMQMGDKIKSKENVKEFTAKPFRITCRKDLTSVLKRITSLTEFAPTEPILKIEQLENSPNAYQQILLNCRSSDAKDLNTSTSEQLKEKVETLPEAEPKVESTTVAPKISEKPFVFANSSGYIAEKRFRCPLCAVNFTIKKSVMRHLKAVHNQSAEQMERLKPRIQMHYVRKKTGTVESKLPPEKKLPFAANKHKSEKDQNKGNWEKICFSCDRQFTNRNAFAAHSRSCNKLAANHESDFNLSRIIASSGRSLQPVVSLTPLPAFSDPSEKSGDTVSTSTSASTLLESTGKRLISPVAASKKMATSLPAPSTTSSATCKKIGIQVRMNYGKAGANPATSTSVNGGAPSSTYPTTPISVATSSSSAQSSANNSRRSSFAASTARNEDSASANQNVSQRSGAVLANILETLIDKKKDAEEQTTATAAAFVDTGASNPVSKSSPRAEARKVTVDKESAAYSAAGLRKKLPKNKATVFCEDCRNSYALDEFRCGTDGPTCGNGNVGRSFRCALPNCDFKCTDKRQLLPHLNAKHALLSESEVAQLRSTFVADCLGARSECTGAAKKRNSINNEKTDVGASALPRRASLPSSNNAAPGNQSGSASKSHQQPSQPPSKVPPPKTQSQPQQQSSAPTLKRKLAAAMPTATQTAPVAKRKPLNVKQSTTSDSELPVVKGETGAAAPALVAEARAPATTKPENRVNEESSRVTQPAMPKKSKKAPTTPASGSTAVASKTSPAMPDSCRSFPRIKIKQTPEKPLVNGIGLAVTSSSSDEENDLPLAATLVATAQSAPKSKANCGVLRKQNTTMPVAEMKSTKTPPASTKAINCHTELSSSSSTPDSDLDPSTLTEENLKKSIMTIIFGKDIPTEKLEEREKSPTSSSTSSDSGKEKRYSVRIAKQSTSTKNIVSVVDCREEKVTKIAIPNKVKATR